MVSAGAALLMQRSGDLKAFHEPVKAILMATATNNIEGSLIFSDKDGAGGIRLDKADDVACGVDGDWGILAYNCATPDPITVATMSLSTGDRTRVALVWNQNPDYVDYADRPSADLDLIIPKPWDPGESLEESKTFDNTYEMVLFEPGAGDDYSIVIDRAGCFETPRFAAWAWWQVP